MVLSLVKGQKIELTKNNPDMNLLHIGLDWKAPKTFDVDVSAFLLGNDEKIVREEDFVFYGQTTSSNGSVNLEESLSTIEKQHFIINLPNVSDEVQKISFTLTIYESELNGYTFQDVTDIKLRIMNIRLQQELAIFPIDYTFTKESAVVLGTLYRYSGEWKFHAVGSGFFGGLSDLCADYGIEVDSSIDESQNPVPTIQPPTDYNQLIQTDLVREVSEDGEAVPVPPIEHVQLKRSSVVQFNERRIETLSNQSEELIHLFDDPQEDEVQTVQLNAIDSQLNSHFFQTEFEEIDQDSFFHSLSEVDKTFLLMFENGKVAVKSAKEYLKKNGLFLALFVNNINEKAIEHLDDNLLQLENESIKVFEEFEPLFEKIKERVRNEH
ncbi:stress response protein SCP2 [Bacillus sp. SLBN-46]|uniref:TerD family protein n=1 Tax=Bacillus sp. SLBN-46 TaxID=3042283 RepID=UPI00285D9902|nr:TerD family protein [Bacillus sp. SLBN-46]MDR6123488.1 stress response protein SCP2 [Bacillus sp. SLBN-46]